MKPCEVCGTVRAPPSKSLTQRAVLLASLADGQSTILSPSTCYDAASAIRIARMLGAKVGAAKGRLVVDGLSSKPIGAALDCAESGFCARVSIPLSATYDGKFKVTGSGTLASRPIGPVEGPMRSLGAKCGLTGGLLPAKVSGPMKGGRAALDCSHGSQFLSGLLMALPVCPEDSELSVSNLKSKPYVRMTSDTASIFGAKIVCDEGLSSFEIEGGRQLKPARVAIEGDWSGAAFLLVAGALAGRVTVGNLDSKSLQADRAIVGALKEAGAEVETVRSSVTVASAVLEGFDFDATDCPDLFPPLAVLAVGCRGTSRIKGARRLRAKESDRAEALCRQLSGLGADIHVRDDTMIVRGSHFGTSASSQFYLRGGAADSEGDHRIAMALVVAGLVSEKGVAIKGHGCVSKSYPGFFGDLARLKVMK
ncbi:MAG: 3-phosphoshikimate 1-carboxyvinyltransferase [Methanobacteriota archaeon]